ncbi:MAG: ABC transporter ATP-binding protein [Candidatus Aquicultor secundus]|uniref:ABC transporter ATP-binding protein n=1 Tax=Candidatus Aquicultor secundus TaxID=1973895 RepID=A0A2M7T5M8_9ACTN|nr:ABC transporter ATP-binding protein [Candidatus Aquicultor secundus]NCO66192.1 ABC transporter ATP-binding protein [Solirubrobacter sp.]OIO85908.1 MAG: ABC transporter ATP-binding protein [Candidatus Aquicultor secundus]PIU27648.1 MAG: ABC transporter ATP-binding protein [Candidatus Aquicultor secundus]PIW23144.1 MAG: ABC transporter ATP-binding protein [Candidatus Aquicultor secundus]PIX52265.1 MAG: ABC transporter ATP-binding protein [Candidatus Aquicultor secundus]
MSLVVVNDLSKYFGNDGDTQVHALEHVSFEIANGEYLAIMGPSGSGKSTLLAILGAMSPPSSGTLVIDQIDVYALSQEKRADFRREYLGFVFQQLQLIPYLTAVENVMLPLVVTNHKNKRELAATTLERVGLGDKLNRLPSEMSGGEQSRVAIARAVVNNPPILLADEPVGSLDSKTGEEVLGLFKQLHSEGQTIIMVTHNPESIRDAERLVQLKDGRIVADLMTKDVIPATKFL